MYIDTHTKISMEQSICDYLGVTVNVLHGLFEYAEIEAQQDKYLSNNQLEKTFDDFIKENLPRTPIDEILFFHLSRRLNTTADSHIGNNLFDLLSTPNEMTQFLKEHDVEFTICDDHLDIIYRGAKIPLVDTSQSNIPYLRWRLGYNADRVDFCFNGFMMKDLLYRNSYARELYDVPEFIGVLATFLNRRDIGTDYFDNGRYYCFEYCVPLSKIVFDQNEYLSNSEKIRYLLKQVLRRLYEYYTHDIQYMFDHDNPIIRLADNDTMQEQYYIEKEEVTWDML